MISKIKKKIKKGALLLALLILFININVFPLEPGKEEVKSCDEAYGDCMVGAPLFVFLIVAYIVYSVYCSMGYYFCKKYVENQR